MNLSCVFDPGACVDGAVASWLAWFPFGSHGLMFAAGMIVGAILGKWGVGAVFAALVALKFSAKGDQHEHVTGPDAAPPVPKHRPTVLKRKP